MKLQKRLNRKVEGKEYSKWVITLPPEYVENLGWREGVELDINMKDGKIVLEPKKS